MNSNADKYNDKVTKEIDKVQAKNHKKYRYQRIHDNNHQRLSAAFCVGEISEIYGILYLIFEKLEKQLPGTSFVTNSIIIF